MMLTAIRRSPQGMRALHTTVSCLAFAAYSVSGIMSAQAQCAASGALGSAGDASTSQALEVVRDRRMQVAQSSNRPRQAPANVHAGCGLRHRDLGIRAERNLGATEGEKASGPQQRPLRAARPMAA